MTKCLLITILYCIVSTNVLSQTQTIDKTNESNQIKEFEYSLNKQFTKVTSGTAFGNLGNFASISSDAKSFTIGGSVLTKQQSIWGFELSAGATEGISKLFNNEKLNSNFSGELKYHKLIKIYFGARNAYDILEIDEQINDLNIQFAKDSLALSEHKDIYKLKVDIVSNNTKINELRKQISKIDSTLNAGLISNETKYSLEATKGLLQFEIENHKLNIFTLNKQLNKIINNEKEYFKEELERKAQIRDKKWMELIKKKQNVELQGFDIAWVSFGLKAKNNEFKLFEPNNFPNLQLKDTNFVSQRFTVAVSRYRSTSFQPKDVYSSVGFFIDYTTNFNTLKKVEIEERTPVSGNSQQEIKRTINAYQGDYKEEIFEFSLFYDYYRFFGQYNSIIGLHLNPNISYYSTIKKPLTNVSVGVVVPLVEREKQLSKLNVELFYNRQDIFNYSNIDIDNSFIGIRATFPITIINYKL